MAQYLLRSSLNPGKVVVCITTFRQIVNKYEDGELVWLVEITTAEPHKNGGVIPPCSVHLTNLDNIDKEIEEATRKIAEQIDWSPLQNDSRAPFVESSTPSDGDNNVNINEDVVIDLKDLLPSAGIDESTIIVTVNGIDVTNEINLYGDHYEYRIVWGPSIRTHAIYNS